MDIVPYLNQIIVPNLRPVNLHLYTPQEKEQLHQVVNTMIDYNLNYVQERTAEGSYVYNLGRYYFNISLNEIKHRLLDPDLEEISNFPGFKSKRNVTYANRQLIAREIELEKMRIVEQQRNGNTNTDKKEKVDKEKPASTQQPQNVPNHMKKLQAKKVRSEVVSLILLRFIFIARIFCDDIEVI